MGKQEQETATPAPQVNVVDADSLAKAFASAIAASAAPRQLTSAEYRGKTPWNPQGIPDHEREQLTRPSFQNGSRIWEWHVTDEDIRNLNQLKAGRYINRKIEVIERDAGNGDATIVEIRYPVSTPERRLELRSYFRSFSEMLKMIVEEQEEKATAPKK